MYDDISKTLKSVSFFVFVFIFGFVGDSPFITSSRIRDNVYYELKFFCTKKIFLHLMKDQIWTFPHAQVFK